MPLGTEEKKGEATFDARCECKNNRSPKVTSEWGRKASKMKSRRSYSTIYVQRSVSIQPKNELRKGSTKTGSSKGPHW